MGQADGNIDYSPGGGLNKAVSQKLEQPGKDYAAEQARLKQEAVKKAARTANPYTVDPNSIREMEWTDFSNQRQQGRNDIDNSLNSGYQSTLANMASRGGLRASDQLAAGNEMQKAKANAATRFNLGMNEMQRKDRAMVDQYNADQMNRLNFYNADAQRNTERFNVGNTLKQDYIDQNIALEDRRLEAQKLAAEQLAAAQEAEANRDAGILEDPWGYTTDKYNTAFGK